MGNIDLEKELKKEIELELEKNKLEEVIQIINSEIINNIEKRKAISDYILGYRAKNIEEFKDDEDKVIEYFDHERYVKEESFKNIDRRIKEMNILLNSPYFGRVDFMEVEYEDEYERIYIGRFGLNPEGSAEPVIVDWRAPVSSIFYAGKLGKVFYKAPVGDIEVDISMKRQFVIKKQKLLGIFDSEVDVKDEILQMVLSQSAGEKLKDIIMTIQSEQDNLIRQPRNKTIVIDGVAGSGKTTIALHRVAYLLYNHRDYLQDKVMIFGPNNIFMEYISTVLPSLGESGVKQSTFQKFAMDVLELDEVMSFGDYMEKILGEDEAFIAELKHKNSKEYTCFLDDYINRLDLEYFKFEDVFYKGIKVTGAKEINELCCKHFKTMPLFRRSKKIKRIIFSKIRDTRDEEYRKLQRSYNEKLNSLSKDELDAEGSELIFRRRLKIRELVQEVINTKKRMSWLNNPDVTDLYKDINENKSLTSDDMAPLLYLKIKLEGLKLQDEIKHVVIDEAQDYSFLQFYVIKQVTGCSALTIVGDSHQRIIPLDDGIPMTELHEDFKDIEVEHFGLNKSYRSTKEIMEYANKFVKVDSFVPLVRIGKEVEVKEIKDIEVFKKSIFEDINYFRQCGYESIAVICRDINDTYRIGSLMKTVDYVKIMDKEDKMYTSGTVVIPSYLAKGMEFDAVIIINGQWLSNGQWTMDNGQLLSESMEQLSDGTKVQQEGESERIHVSHLNKLRYVMATRALHELKVYNIKE